MADGAMADGTDETPTAIDSDGGPRPSALVPRSRLRVRECLCGVLAGDVQLLPALVFVIFKHITEAPAATHVDAYTQQVIARGVEVLQDLSEVVQALPARPQLNATVVEEASPPATPAPPLSLRSPSSSPPASPASPASHGLVAVLVHATLFALGASTGVRALRPMGTWCAVHFFVPRLYEASLGVAAVGRVLLPPPLFARELRKFTFALAALFFVMDCPLGSQLHSARLFGGYAGGLLLYRGLFGSRRGRASRALDGALAAFDLVHPSSASYTLLGLRVGVLFRRAHSAGGVW